MRDVSDPARASPTRPDRSIGLARVDQRHCARNLRLNRWYGWAGAADSLWAQSLRLILDAKELGASAELVRAPGRRPRSCRGLTQAFGSAPTADPPELVLVNTAKALAAFQETITTARTAFDAFRDALASGNGQAMANYPLAAQRGLKIFVGKGRCTVCHHGANFSNGEFDDIGIPFFAEPGRVDPGRHGGIAALRASPFNLLRRYNDDPSKATASPQRVEQLHRNWGELACPPAQRSGTAPTCTTAALHGPRCSAPLLRGRRERLRRRRGAPGPRLSARERLLTW
jgi:cytochrome c peroxidase